MRSRQRGGANDSKNSQVRQYKRIRLDYDFIEPNVPWVSVITVPGIHVREGNRPGLCAKGERTIKRPATQPIRFVRSGYADTAVANNQAGTPTLPPALRVLCVRVCACVRVRARTIDYACV